MQKRIAGSCQSGVAWKTRRPWGVARVCTLLSQIQMRRRERTLGRGIVLPKLGVSVALLKVHRCFSCKKRSQGCVYHGVEARGIGCQARSLHLSWRLQWLVCFCPDIYHSQHFHSSLKICFPPGIISLQPEELPLAFLEMNIFWQRFSCGKCFYEKIFLLGMKFCLTS